MSLNNGVNIKNMGSPEFISLVRRVIEEIEGTTKKAIFLPDEDTGGWKHVTIDLPRGDVQCYSAVDLKNWLVRYQ